MADDADRGEHHEWTGIDLTSDGPSRPVAHAQRADASSVTSRDVIDTPR